jgi:peptidoglycan/LPS O-acetylase OafA/YrhL
MLIAFVIGVALHWSFFWGFTSYSNRAAYHPSRRLFMFLTGLSGFAVNVGVETGKYRVASCILGGLFLSNLVLIIVDCWSDPTNHNLAPFEFIMIGFLALPAFIGAGFATAFTSSEDTSMKL